MGNHRLRLSDMMPNAWFCKLKYMNQPQRNLQPTKKTTNPQAQSPRLQQPLIPNRASYYFPSNSSFSPLLHPKAFDTHFPLDSPRKSTTQLKPPRRIPAIVTSSSSSSSSSSLSFSSSCRGSVSESDSDNQSHCITKNVSTAHISQLELGLELPPIITKPTTTAKEINTAKPKKAAPATRRLRMRTSGPSAKRLQVREKKKKSGVYSESFAVVKSTSDPRSDFRESMAEMVLENGLTSSSELEDLLACYLSLNSNEYHHVIVEVFEEIWFDNRHHY